jgi:parvulin-like peptidyl-prolyl isomerase
LPKKKNTKPQREMTRRQLTHWQRESRIQRFTLFGGILVIVAVLIVVGTGVFFNKLAPARAVVVKAGNTEFSYSYYVDALSYYGKANYYIYQQYGLTYDQYLQYTTDSVAQAIERNAFIKDAAAKLDPPVTVSDDEINKYVTDNKVTPVSQAAKDVIYAQLLDPKLKAFYDKQVPQTAEQRAVLAIFLESENQVASVKAQLAGGAAFGDLAAQLSLESNSKSKNGDFGFVPKGVLGATLGSRTDTVLEDLVFNSNTAVNTPVLAEDKDQSKNIGYWVLEVTDYQTPTPTPTATGTPSATATPTPTPTPSQPHVLAMLLGSQEQADQIKAQLDNGADFVTLAKANSQYSNAATDGGDLSFIGKGKLGGAADAVLFPDDTSKALAPGTITSPIADTSQTTKDGFWLAEITSVDPNKTVDGNNRTTLTDNLTTDWENKVWSDNSSQVQSLLTPDQTTNAISEATARGS